MPKSKKKRQKRVNPIITEQKQLEIKFISYIQENNLIGLENLLSNEHSLHLLKKNRHLDPFVISIKANHLNLIKYFLQKNFHLRTSNNKTEDLPTSSKDLHSNSEFSETELASTSVQGYSYCRALIEAIKCSNLEALEILLKLGINVNSSDYKHVPLQVAYNVYSIEKENILLGKCVDKFGLEKSFNIFKKLINNNAEPNIYNNKGYRLIHQIILDKDIEALEFLLANSKNLKINALTYGKMQNSLHLLNETKMRSSVRSSTDHLTPVDPDLAIPNDNTEATPPIQVDSVPVNWTNSKQVMTKLNLRLAKILIDAGCDMNHTDYQSFETPAFKAIVNNYYDLIKFFVVEGMDMSARNRCGNDVLSRSIQLGRYKIARLLIAADSPIRLYSCFYKIPNIEEFKTSNSILQRLHSNLDNIKEEDIYDEETINSENFLQYSIGKYESFLTFLQKYTREPRSLLDLSRLVVRNGLRKPISKYLLDLRLSKHIRDILLLTNIDNMIQVD